MSETHPGLIAPYDPQPNWTCEVCNGGGTPWVTRFAGKKTVLAAHTDALRCGEHSNTRIKCGNRDVTFADLGAAKAYVIEGGVATTKLYIWSDVELGTRLGRSATTQSSLEYWYWRRGGPQLELRGQVISIADVLTSSTSVPRGESEFTHTLPVASRYLQLVDTSKTRWQDAKGCWEIWFHGRPDSIESTAPADVASPERRLTV